MNYETWQRKQTNKQKQGKLIKIQQSGVAFRLFHDTPITVSEPT
jgi:hypothetical protein